MERNETFIHFTECPRLRTYQNESFLDNEISKGWSIDSILTFSYKGRINEAVEGLNVSLEYFSMLESYSSEDSFRYDQPEPCLLYTSDAADE